MPGSSAYRAPLAHAERYAPQVGWTRAAAIGLTLVGLVIPAYSVFELCADHDCSGVATPHVDGVALVAVMAAALAFASLAAHRRAAAWVVRRVRVASRMAGAGAATTTLLPAIALGVVSAAFAAWLGFAYTFHICFDFGTGGWPFAWSGC